ncbi:MAG: BamA/TamA family outer membrane protein [Gemmatimonadetes bacterium]|nr:BamA/TamA family outer membrane protein [Gemmatimonadota bacterium]
MKKPTAMLLFVLAWFAMPAGVVRAEPVAPWVVEQILIEGNTRTDRDVVLRIAGVSEGDTLDPADAGIPAARLESSALFHETAVRFRKGTARGFVVMEVTLVERGVGFQIGAGVQDLGGWYLLPAEINLDNRLGRGEKLRIRLRVGYRYGGAELVFREAIGEEASWDWGVTLSGIVTDRVFYDRGVSFTHGVRRATYEMQVGRALSDRWRIEAGAGLQEVDADSSAEAREDALLEGWEAGDPLVFDSLPEGIARGVGREARGVFRVDLVLDGRSPSGLAGTPGNGVWGRVRAEAWAGERRSYAALSGDLRLYRHLVSSLMGGLHLRGGWIGDEAPFYDRYYTGGLYSARGFEGQSLSPSGGDTKFWTASLEVRAPLIGNGRSPRLSGIAFLDVADGWTMDAPRLGDAHVSAGYGIRVRVPWIDIVGLDVGIPLTRNRADESFRAHASLGWTF